MNNQFKNLQQKFIAAIAFAMLFAKCPKNLGDIRCKLEAERNRLALERDAMIARFDEQVDQANASAKSSLESLVAKRKAQVERKAKVIDLLVDQYNDHQDEILAAEMSLSEF